jgi:DNA replication factor GINS
MDLAELRTALSREQAHTELQPLDDDFYERVGEYIASVRRTRQDRIADTATPFDDAEIQRLSDELNTAKELTTKLYERRTTKVLDKALLAAFGYETDVDAMTPREHALFEETVSQIDKTAQNMIPELADSE